MGILDEAGHELTGEVLGADVAIVNTCSFISAAVEESREVIERCLALKREGTVGGVLVAGCLPQRYGEDTLRMFPDVDAVVASSAFDRIAEALEKVAIGERPVLVREPTAIYDHRSPRILGTPPHLAYVKIAEGCDNRCSYCTIPSIRGRLRSRAPDSILTEASELAALGVQEINVIAQDTTAYGTDIAHGISLADLLRQLGRVGVPWVRVLYTHPAHVTDELLSALREEPCVLPYLDLPVQHVADGILRAMGRRISGEKTRRLLGRARALVPDLTIRSTVMLGFPGETEEDFEELLEFVKAGHVDHLGVFEFSPEPGTAAAEMPGQVDREVASARAKAVHEEALRIAEKRGRGLVGTDVVVLSDGPGTGRTSGQAWETDGSILWEEGLANEPSTGTFFEARVTEALGFDLAAVPTGGGARPRVRGETA